MKVSALSLSLSLLVHYSITTNAHIGSLRRPVKYPWPLVDRGWDPDTSVNKLPVCHGDCDSDTDCDSGLTCVFDYVPSECSGTTFNSGYDYCSYGYNHLLNVDHNPDTSVNKLKMCHGDCDSDTDCASGLTCLQRTSDEDPGPPECSGTPKVDFDYCHDKFHLVNIGRDPDTSVNKLKKCHGNCKSDTDCDSGLLCFHRNSQDPGPPGCNGTPYKDTNYCYELQFVNIGWDTDTSVNKIKLCQGDCDSDSDCASGLTCFQRHGEDPGPSECNGTPEIDMDYCTLPTAMPSIEPSPSPSEETMFTSLDKLQRHVKIYCGNPDNYHSNYGNIEDWDVSQITSMKSLFDADNLKCDIPDISKWDVSRVTNFFNMFYGATHFNVDIGSWDVSRVTSFNAMFRGATDFNQDISKWKVSEGTDFGHMFYKATSFNCNISNWNVSEAILFNAMFHGASLFNQNVGKWDVSKVTDFSFVFDMASSFRQNLHAWLKWVNKSSKNQYWCNRGATCDASVAPTSMPSVVPSTSFSATPSIEPSAAPTENTNECYGKNKRVCEKLEACFFYKSIFKSCKPKNSSDIHVCADYDDEESCTDDENHGGLCKFDSDGCSHVCDDLNEKQCKKLQNKKDNKHICNPTKVSTPCNGCQLKTLLCE